MSLRLPSVLLKRSWWVWGVISGAGAGIGWLLVNVMPEVVGRESQRGIFTLVALWVMAVIWAVRVNPLPRRVEVDVEASREGLRVSDGTFVPSEQLRAARLQGHDRVRLLRTAPRFAVDLAVDDEATAQALVEALGLDPSQRVVRHRAGSPVMRVMDAHGCVVTAAWVALIPTVVIGIAVLSPWVLLAPLMGLVLGLVPSDIAVGADGLEWSWLGIRRYVAWGDVRKVRLGRRHNLQVLVIEKHTGGELRIPLAHAKRSDSARVRAVVREVTRARDAFNKRTVATPSGALARVLSNPDKGMGERVMELRGLLSKADYRREHAAPEQLWSVVEDPRSPAFERAAAAVALESRDSGAKQRLRIVAEAAMAPQLRVALEAAQADDEAALVDALEDLEADVRG